MSDRPQLSVSTLAISASSGTLIPDTQIPKSGLFSSSPISRSASPDRLKQQKSLTGIAETRKLLLHLLSRLQDALEPFHAELFSAISADARAIDSIFDLALQVRDVLNFARERSWDLFGSPSFGPGLRGTSPPGSPGSSSPGRRFFRNSPPASPSRKEPAQQHAADDQFIEAQHLLMQLIGRLAVFAGSHQIGNFSLSRPPLALQSIFVDILLILQAGLASDLQQLALQQTALTALVSFQGNPKRRLIQYFTNATIKLDKRLQAAQSAISAIPNFATGHPAIHVQQPTDSSPSNYILRPLALEDGNRKIVVSGRATSEAALLSSDTLRGQRALIPALLDALLADIESESMTAHNSLILLRLLVDTFPSLHQDLLNIVAYGSSSARMRAVSALYTLYASILPHHTVCSALLIAETTHSTEHYWSIQYFATSDQVCATCRETVAGFALACTAGVHQPLHIDCYDATGGFSMVNFAGKHGTKVGALRYQLVKEGSGEEIGGHRFYQANLFGLTLCHCCSEPLWGMYKQAYICIDCCSVVHTSCLASVFTPCSPSITFSLSQITIDWNQLRRSFVDAYADAILSKDEILRLSYAEAAITHSTLAAQLEILNIGIASGTCIVEQESPQRVEKGDFDPFELHFYTQLFGRACESAQLVLSPLMDDYFADQRQAHFIFSPDFRILLASYLRRPENVCLTEDHLDFDSDHDVFTVIDASLAKEVLQREFQLKTRLASQSMLDALCQARTTISHDTHNISFGLPSLLDETAAADATLSAIEACLIDQQPEVQEFGFLLLTSKCAPIHCLSDICVFRIVKALLRWCTNDKDQLLAVARSKIAPQTRQRNPSTAGGAEVLRQRAQFNRLHVQPWLKSLAALSSIFSYGELLFDASVSIMSDSPGAQSRPPVEQIARLLTHLRKLEAIGVVRDQMNYLVGRWLQEAIVLDISEVLINKDMKNQVMRLFETDYWQSLFIEADRPLLDKLCMFRLLVSMGVPPGHGVLASLATQCHPGDLASVAVLLDGMVYLAGIDLGPEVREATAETLVDIFSRQQSFLMTACEIANTEAQNIVRFGLAAYALLASVGHECLQDAGLLDQRAVLGQRASPTDHHFLVCDRIIDFVAAFVQSESITLRAVIRAWLYVMLVVPNSRVDGAAIIEKHGQLLLSIALSAFRIRETKSPRRMPFLLSIVINLANRSLVSAILASDEPLYTFNELTYDLVEYLKADKSSRLQPAMALAPFLLSFFSLRHSENIQTRNTAELYMDVFTQDQLAAISQVLTQSLSSSDVSTRLEICCLARSMRIRLPDWTVISYSKIVEALCQAQPSTDLQQALLLQALICAGPPDSRDDKDTVKLELAKALGFAHCQLVSAGKIRYGSLLPAKPRAIAIFSSLKSVFDSPVHLSTVSRIDELGESENRLIGHRFLPIFLDYIQGLDPAELSHIDGCTLLESLLVVICKQDITPFTEPLFEVAKKLCSALQTTCCPYDIRSTIWACLTCLLEFAHKSGLSILGRAVSASLTAMLPIWPTKEGLPFMKKALLHYRDQEGVFVLIFRALASDEENLSPTNSKLRYTILKAIIESVDLHQRASLYDAPLADLNSIMAISRPENFSSILRQVRLYVEHTHGGDLSVSTMERFAIFLSRFGRFMHDCPHALEVDSLCKTIAVVLAATQADVSQPFESSMVGFIQLSVRRFGCSQNTLESLLNPGKKLNSTRSLLSVLASATEEHLKNIAHCPPGLLELLKVVPPKLAALSDQTRLQILSQTCINTLCSATFLHSFRRQDFDCLVATAGAALLSPSVWPTLLSDPCSAQLCAYNLAALSSLLNSERKLDLPFVDSWHKAIASLALFRLPANDDSNERIQEAAKVLAQLHLSIKLLLLSGSSQNLTWTAPYLACIEEALASTSSPTLITLITSYLADLLLFLHEVKSPTVYKQQLDWTTLCDTAAASCSGVIPTKLQRAMNSWTTRDPARPKQGLVSSIEREAFSCFKLLYQQYDQTQSNTGTHRSRE